MSRICLALLSLAAAAAAQPQQYHLPWEQQTDMGSIPAWYAPKNAGFAASAGSSMALPPSMGSAASSPYAARPSYPPNFPGYPTFGTAHPVGGVGAPKSGRSFTTTYKPKTTAGLRPKPSGSRSNLDKYLPLMRKKMGASSSTMTSSTISKTTPLPSTTRRRKLPTKKTTVTKRVPTTTTTVRTTTARPTTVRPKTTTVAESGEWDSLEIVEATTKRAIQTTSTVRQTTSEKRKEQEKKEEKKDELVKGPIVNKGRPSSSAPLSTTTPSLKSIEEEEAEFNLLGFLWDKSELLASIKNMIKQLKSSIDEAGLEEDVKQVSDHFKNTIKTFASASPVNEQLGRLFERAQNSDVKLD